MKLNDLLKEVFAYGPLTYDNGYSDYVLRNPYLKLYKDRILQTDEFKEVKDLEIIDAPVCVIDGKFVSAASYIMHHNSKFEGECLLYSINLTPSLTRPSDLTDSFVEGGSITPILYDYKDFSPYRMIGLKYKPYSMNFLGEEEPSELRKGLHKLLDSVLDNSKKYEVPEKRNVYIRGSFGSVKTDSNEKEIFDFREEEIIL
jgi:hypothetical protein